MYTFYCHREARQQRPQPGAVLCIASEPQPLPKRPNTPDVSSGTSGFPSFVRAARAVDGATSRLFQAKATLLRRSSRKTVFRSSSTSRTCSSPATGCGYPSGPICCSVAQHTLTLALAHCAATHVDPVLDRQRRVDQRTLTVRTRGREVHSELRKERPVRRPAHIVRRRAHGARSRV
jgi:hypothetical protein